VECGGVEDIVVQNGDMVITKGFAHEKWLSKILKLKL
jgi:hypothetical protein